MLQCVAVCCSVLQYVAAAKRPLVVALFSNCLLTIWGLRVFCSVLQCKKIKVTFTTNVNRLESNRSGFHLNHQAMAFSKVKSNLGKCRGLVVKAEARSVRFRSVHICGECDLNLLTVCCSVLQCVAVCCSVLQCVAVCCSVLQCVAVCFSV